MLPNLLLFLYRKLGRWYPYGVLWAQSVVAQVVAGAGLVVLQIYQEMSTRELLELVLVAELLMVLENILGFRMSKKILRPVWACFAGDDSPQGVARAWTALAELPSIYLRRWWTWPILANVTPFSIAATVLLGLQWWAFLFFFVGGLVVFLYGGTLRFFSLEVAFQPVLEDLGSRLPGDHVIDRGGIPLRMRLLFGLPVLNIISGVVVAGLATGGEAQKTLSDLGVDIAIAVLVAGTVSFELTLLLARSVIAPVSELQKATRAVGRGDYSVRVPVVSSDDMGRLSQSFNRMVGGLEERERLREAFGAFVDPGLAERVIKEGTLLEGVEADVSVLFLDIRGFTALAERSTAREVVDRLNDLYELVVPIVARHGGHANKFIGDGLLAVFGAPAPLPDHADRAVAAALEIAGSVHRRYGADLQIGIGVNSGPVVAGTVGGGGRVEFTVIGDTVNTAARVEEATRVSGDDVLITAATCERLRRRLALEERPAIPLKGKREPVGLFAPAPAGTPGPVAPPRSGAGRR